MKILVPIDFSECSINAYQYALDLALETRADVTIFHASHQLSTVSNNMMIRVDDIVMEEAERGIEQLKLNSIHLPVRISHTISVGLANDEIKKITSEKDYDLIVMGTTGSSGLEDKLIGTITSNLIRMVNKPILVVPEKAKYNPNNPILVSVDIDDNKEINFSPLKNILTKNNKLNIFYVSDKRANKIEEKDINYLEQHLNDYPHDYKFKHNDDVIKSINDELNTHEYNLVVTFNKKYSFFEGLFHKSISKNLALHSKTPLLIIK